MLKPLYYTNPNLGMNKHDSAMNNKPTLGLNPLFPHLEMDRSGEIEISISGDQKHQFLFHINILKFVFIWFRKKTGVLKKKCSNKIKGEYLNNYTTLC